MTYPNIQNKNEVKELDIVEHDQVATLGDIMPTNYQGSISRNYSLITWNLLLSVLNFNNRKWGLRADDVYPYELHSQIDCVTVIATKLNNLIFRETRN